jgi:hypothetical protein
MPDENLPDEGDTTAKGLRSAYEAMKKQNDELLSELGKFRKEQRVSQVAGVLKAKGAPEGAASLYTGEDTSEAAVTKWLEQYAGVFGVKQEQAAGAPPVADPNADAARRIAGNAYGNLEGLSAPPTGEPILGDPAEMEYFMRTAPIEELQKHGLYPKSGTLFNP